MAGPTESKSPQDTSVEAMAQLRTFHTMATPTGKGGKIQLNDLEKAVTIQGNTNASGVEKIQFLATLMTTISEKEWNAQNTALHDIAKLVWESHSFKAVDKTAKKTITDLRDRLTNDDGEKIKIWLQNTFAKIRNVLFNLSGIDSSDVKTLHSFFQDAEKKLTNALGSGKDPANLRTAVNHKISSIKKLFKEMSMKKIEGVYANPSLRQLNSEIEQLLTELADSLKQQRTECTTLYNEIMSTENMTPDAVRGKLNNATLTPFQRLSVTMFFANDGINEVASNPEKRPLVIAALEHYRDNALKAMPETEKNEAVTVLGRLLPDYQANKDYRTALGFSCKK